MATAADQNTSEPTDGNQDGNQGGNVGKVDGKTAEEWARSYKGLQSHVNKLNKQIEGLEGERDDAIATLEATKADLEELKGEKGDLSATIQELEEQLEGKEGELEKLNAKVERQELIMSDFPELAKFEAKGLLPDADNPDDLSEKLSTFQETLGEEIEGSIQEALDGSSLPHEDIDSTEGDSEMTEEQVYQAMMRAAEEGDDKAYNELLDRWDEINS